jgi:hypothetical protein
MTEPDNSETMDNSEAMKKQEKKEFLRRLRAYRKTMRHTLATTRFTEPTWEENCKSREMNPKARCIYGTPVQISRQVAIDANIFVLEMNNSRDKIMGIGLIKNRPIVGKYAVYSKGNYNRYVYAGSQRSDREEMTEIEQSILLLLEELCFRGINHSKRGQGISAFPLKLQYKSAQLGLNLMESVCEMFKLRMTSSS